MSERNKNRGTEPQDTLLGLLVSYDEIELLLVLQLHLKLLS